MWSGASAGVASQTNRLACHYPVTHLNKTLREVAVVGLDAVVVADDNQCAVARIGAFREAYFAVKCRTDCIANRQCNINSVVVATMAHTIARRDATEVWIAIVAERIYEVYRDGLRQ